jgi:hypothetical protein
MFSLGQTGRTKLANALLQHLILARQILRLSLVERALVAAGRGAGEHVVVAVDTSQTGHRSQSWRAGMTTAPRSVCEG